MSDTISQEEVFVHTLRGKNSVENLLDRIADYYYIYGEKRSWFMADWGSTLRDAILMDSHTDNPHAYKRTKPIVKDVLKNASEYTAYDMLNKDEVVETICREGQRIYQAHEQQNFLYKLAGERLEAW